MTNPTPDIQALATMIEIIAPLPPLPTPGTVLADGVPMQGPGPAVEADEPIGRDWWRRVKLGRAGWSRAKAGVSDHVVIGRHRTWGCGNGHNDGMTR